MIFRKYSLMTVLGASAFLALASLTPGYAGQRDDEEAPRQHDDNGHHYGWYKNHHRSNHRNDRHYAGRYHYYRGHWYPLDTYDRPTFGRVLMRHRNRVNGYDNVGYDRGDNRTGWTANARPHDNGKHKGWYKDEPMQR